MEVSSVESFARVVSPCNWESVPILMLTVCFDAAGKESDAKHTVVTVAGFASFAGAWDGFQKEWNARLSCDGLEAFHASDFAQFTEEFKSGWKDNEPRRQKLCADLMDIIATNGLRRFGCVVPLAVHRGMDQALMKNMRIDAYVHGATHAVDRFNNYAFNVGVRNNIRYVFEKGDSEGALRQRFQEDGYKTPDFTWKQKHTDRKGFTDDGFVGLQAADWLAYEYYLDFTRVLDPNKTPTRRWALSQFESLPGEIQGQVGLTAQHNQETFRIRRATRYLEDIKNKRN